MTGILKILLISLVVFSAWGECRGNRRSRKHSTYMGQQSKYASVEAESINEVDIPEAKLAKDTKIAPVEANTVTDPSADVTPITKESPVVEAPLTDATLTKKEVTKDLSDATKQNVDAPVDRVADVKAEPVVAAAKKTTTAKTQGWFAGSKNDKPVVVKPVDLTSASSDTSNSVSTETGSDSASTDSADLSDSESDSGSVDSLSDDDSTSVPPKAKYAADSYDSDSYDSESDEESSYALMDSVSSDEDSVIEWKSSWDMRLTGAALQKILGGIVACGCMVALYIYWTNLMAVLSLDSTPTSAERTSLLPTHRETTVTTRYAHTGGVTPVRRNTIFVVRR